MKSRKSLPPSKDVSCTISKQQKREAKKNLKEARAILFCMESYLEGKEQQALDMACAFFHVLNYHLEQGDLRPHHVHLAALLRKEW